MVDIQALINQEADAYVVPRWIVGPLVQAESGGDPTKNNAGHIGLLQISPLYPGAAGHDLTDPKENLDVGLRQMKKYLDKHPEDYQRSQASFEDVISHTGWDQWGGWAKEGIGEGPNVTPQQVKDNYDKAYNALSSGGSHWWDQNPLGDFFTAVTNLPGQEGQAAKDKAGDIICSGTPFVCFFKRMLDDTMKSPWKLLVILVCLFILISASWKAVNAATSGGAGMVAGGFTEGVAGGPVRTVARNYAKTAGTRTRTRMAA